MNTYDAALEALPALPLEDQESLLEVVRRRLAEHRRAELIATVTQARKGKPATAAAILRQVEP